MARDPPRPPPPPQADPSTVPPASYALVYTLNGHTGKVASVKFSPDGTKLASSGEDGLVNLWDSATGQHLRTLAGHDEGVSDIAFSSDSRFLASGSDDNSVRIWTVEHGVAIHPPLLAHQDAVFCLAFNPQGNLLASGGKDECVWLWDVRRGKPHLTLPAHSDPVSGVHFNRDGTILVSCSWDGLIRMWDTSSGQCLKTLVHDDSVPIAHVSFSPNGLNLLSTTLDSTTRLWNYHNSKCMKTFSGATLERFGCPSQFMLHPRRRAKPVYRKGKGKEVAVLAGDGTVEEVWVVGGSEDGRVIGWEVQSRRVVLTLQASEEPIISVAVHPTLPRIASASVGSDRSIRIWEHRGSLPSKVGEADANGTDDVAGTFAADPERASRSGSVGTGSDLPIPQVEEMGGIENSGAEREMEVDGAGT